MKPRNLKQDLARMEMMRATAFKVAAAFAHLADTVPANQGAALFAAQARRIRKCASSLYVAVIRPGQILFEMGGLAKELAQEAIRRAGHKLSVQTRFITKE